MQNTPLHLIAERDMPEIAQMFLCRPDVEINRQNKVDPLSCSVQAD
jgi:hypothetical protein